MNILFVHSHKFRKISSKMFSLGGLSEKVLKRYVNSENDKVTVVARVVQEEKSLSIYSEIKDKNINILDISQIKIKGLREEIEKADMIIVRMPCIIGIMAINMARKYKKKYLIEVVGCAWDSYWNHGIKGKIIAPFMYYAMRKEVKNSENVLYVSDEFLQKRYPSNRKLYSMF